MNITKTYLLCRSISAYCRRKCISIPRLNYSFAKKLHNTHQTNRLCLQFTSRMNYSISTNENESIDANTFEKVCEETLESLSEYFEQIVEASNNLASADVSYSTGVLTVNLGPQYGTYVINRQSPNKQIWLSSPTSGPKRFDFVPKTNNWIYRHSGQDLHGLLQEEISKIANTKVDFLSCLHSSDV